MQNLGKKSASEASSTLKSGARREQYEKARLKTSTAQEFDRTARKIILSKKRGMAFLRSTQSCIARDFERELKTASRGTLGGLAMFH